MAIYKVNEKLYDLPEDIVEELGRFFGYDNIPSELPKKGLAPSNIDSILSVREIKRLCARSLRMREVSNYAFYDEASSYVNDAEIQNLFTELRDEEAEHARMIKEIITALPPEAHMDLDDED